MLLRIAVKKNEKCQCWNTSLVWAKLGKAMDWGKSDPVKCSAQIAPEAPEKGTKN